MDACALLPTLLQLGQAAAASFLAALLWPVAFPLNEDVVEAGAGADARSRERGSVLLAGSFNPPHRGHLALLAQLSRRYDKVYAVVGFNPSKTYAVGPEQGCRLLAGLVAQLPNVQPVAVEGYIWGWALARGCSRMFRGIRSLEQDGRNERLLELQNRLGPVLLAQRWPLRTTFLLSPPELRELSSTKVRALVDSDGGEESLAALAALVGSRAAAEEVHGLSVRPLSTAELQPCCALTLMRTHRPSLSRQWGSPRPDRELEDARTFSRRRRGCRSRPVTSACGAGSTVTSPPRRGPGARRCARRRPRPRTGSGRPARAGPSRAG